MISAVSDCMAMSRSFWNRKVVLLLTQLVPGLVHGSAVCCSGPETDRYHPGIYVRHRPIAKATQVVPGQYVAGFFPSAEI